MSFTSVFPLRRAVAAGAVAVLAGTGALLATPASAAPTHVAAAPTHAVAAAPAKTAAAPQGKVVSKLPLNIRVLPTTDSQTNGSLAVGAVVKLSCKVRGMNVDGNAIWYKLYNGSGWVAARYVQNLSAVAYCD